jgi:hypothetical protein
MHMLTVKLALSNPATHQYLTRAGIKLHARAKDQHAWFIERRGAFLRDAIHRIDSQLKEEGLTGVPFTNDLAEVVFCGNALLSFNGSALYIIQSMEGTL